MLSRLAEQFIHHLRMQGYSSEYIHKTSAYISDFISYLQESGICDIREVTVSIVSRYYRDIYWKDSSRGRPYSVWTISDMISSLRCFFRFLAAGHILLTNPAFHLTLPRLDRIPRNILSVDEVEALLSQPGRKSFKGKRDRAILELFYSTGIRRRELVNLNMCDVYPEDELLFIRRGKGDKDRIVPLGRWAAVHLKSYLEAREHITHSETALFICVRSKKRIDYHMVNILVREYARRAGIEKRVSCHVLRHTCAVHMLEGGADVRYIQELLGHTSISTTQIYLQVSKEALKKAHRECHPRGKMPHKGNNIW